MKTEETSVVASDKPLLTVAYLETLPDDNNRYELIAFTGLKPGVNERVLTRNLKLETSNSKPETPKLETRNLLLRFSRAQLIGALVILTLLWLVILFRMLFSRA